MLDLFIRLAITVVQLGLIQFIFSNIKFADGDKANEKTALKNYLQGFLMFVVGFTLVMNLVYRFTKFPRKLQMPLFFGGLLILTAVWVTENRDLVYDNMKHTWVGKLIGKQVAIVKETMAVDPKVSEAYPFHFYEPTSQLGDIEVADYVMQEDHGAKMVLERNLLN